uniref:Uncharacterized protein n=1 Tax=Tanacetum cinerariifolium TaxID=118510 RepID=A0A6L2P5J7_TANCI|nr:hypothetical protein [Tanacetum cinerariifolium]
MSLYEVHGSSSSQTEEVVIKKVRFERAGPDGTVGAGTGSYEPSEKSMMDIDACDYRFIESKVEREDRMEREKICKERRKERERERRLEAKDTAMRKKSKITRDQDRKELVALVWSAFRVDGSGSFVGSLPFFVVICSSCDGVECPSSGSFVSPSTISGWLRAVVDNVGLAG